MRRAGIFLAGVLTLFLSAPLHALSPGVIDPTVELDATKSMLISSLYAKRGESFAEVYNNTERPIDLAGWRLRFITATSESDVLLPSGWLLPDTFISLSENGVVPGILSFPVLSLPVAEAITNVQVIDNNDQLVSAIAIFPADITAKWYQRKSTGVSGTFTSDFSAATTSTKLRHTPLYAPPTIGPLLRVVEIYPRASDCNPTDTSVLCGDYIKLYNPSNQTAFTSSYRLRSDSSTSESSNAFHLDAYDDVAPGGYLTVSFRDDGDKLSLTDSGGWIWLEDAEGVNRYEETVVTYPSAGSDSKIGYAWALTSDDTWQWSSTPSPGVANSFPLLEPGMGAGVLGELSDCPTGKYRNPETNRCRNIEEAIATLVTCPEGQTRNPMTNRCRSSSIASTTLTPCDVGQERNPATNRCRSITGSTGLTPCPTGQSRNSETNRCRKTILSAALSPAAIDPVKQQTYNPFVMTLLGAVGVGAVGYGIYEWRSEILGSLRKATARVGKK